MNEPGTVQRVVNVRDFEPRKREYPPGQVEATCTRCTMHVSLSRRVWAESGRACLCGGVMKEDAPKRKKGAKRGRRSS